MGAGSGLSGALFIGLLGWVRVGMSCCLRRWSLDLSLSLRLSRCRLCLSSMRVRLHGRLSRRSLGVGRFSYDSASVPCLW